MLSFQAPVDSKFTEPKPLVIYHGSGQCWQLSAYHKRRPKPRTIVELQETLQMIWDSLPQRPIDSSQSDWRLVLKLRVDILNILSDCRILTFCCCLNEVIYCVLARTFLSALQVATWQRCNADNFKTLYDNEILLIPICMHMMTT